MTTDIKRHIDSARQVLVGVVPNPSEQINQITYALIYKFMDDMDQAAIKSDDDPAFFIKDLERYSWARLMDTKIGNQERMNLYVEAFQKFGEAKQLPELFRNILKSAFLPYRSPETLGLFLKEVDYFNYSHPEELGNAYEYLLSIMSSQGDAGQFRTPRHIIDFMVEVVNPTKDDKILDPACGTGGFLISSFKHILKQHDGEEDPNKIEKPLNPDQRISIMNNFEGYDIDPNMVRIAQVNMYLHQFKNPQIYQYDSLSSEERWNDKFDVILANPPFMSPKGGIRPHDKFTIQSTRSEVLFVDYFMTHLRPKGRAGIIVPEGIIFQSGTSYKQLRKSLVEDGLYAVVSLPSGVFNPYSGVKTSILLFNNEIAKQTKDIVFIRVEKEGYDLGAQRRPLCVEVEKGSEWCQNHSDFPIALEILNKWKLGKKVEDKLVLYVEKSKITKNDDYNLSGERYRSTADRVNTKWQMVKLDEIAVISKGSAITEKDTKIGTVPVIAGGQSPAYFHNEANRTGDVITVSASGAYAGFVNYFNFPIFASDCSTIQSKDKSIVSTKYVFYVLKANQKDIYNFQQGGGQPHVYPKDLKTIKIPLPALEIQEQIVKGLDGYSSIINSAKQIVENWKPKIEIDPAWKKVKLGDIASFNMGGTPAQKEINSVNAKIPWVKGSDLIKGHIFKTDNFITEVGMKSSRARYYSAGSILVGRTGQGKTRGTVALLKIKATTNETMIGIFPGNNLLSSEYLYYFLGMMYVDLRRIGGENERGGLTQQDLREFIIKLPSLKIQKQIVEEIEAERALVESNKKLIEIYENKIKNTIARLWTE